MKYGGRWAANKIEVENEKTKHQSVLEFTARDLNVNSPDRLFTIGELEGGT